MKWAMKSARGWADGGPRGQGAAGVLSGQMAGGGPGRWLPTEELGWDLGPDWSW